MYHTWMYNSSFLDKMGIFYMGNSQNSGFCNKMGLDQWGGADGGDNAKIDGESVKNRGVKVEKE